MHVSPSESLVHFGLFQLDLKAQQLHKNGRRIRLSQQPVQVLTILVERAGEVVTREELQRRLWSPDVFVDFDHGLNKAVQKLRDALGDSADSPRFIETIPKIGYRFLAPVRWGRTEAEKPAENLASTARRHWWWYAGAAACLGFALVGVALYRSRERPLELKYTQLTDFTDSAVAPALSPDGRMMAFIRGGNGFLTSDPIYVKMLPDGEARRVTDDSREKYGLAFSPDGSEIAYTVFEPSGFSTYEVSALGGEPQLLLKNAAGLVWLDPQRLLFSEIKSGIHMGVVTATLTRSNLREIYFPAHERGMAHFSFPSPDRRWALVVEMNGNGGWGQCRLINLEGQAPSRVIGPTGACTSAGWSPNGRWMYFTAAIQGRSHIWRQRFPDGPPEQVTSGPTDEAGVAVEPDGRALITSVGSYENAIWIHDGNSDRPLSSEGEVLVSKSSPVFAPGGRDLYYLLRRGQAQGAELWRTVVASGQSEVVFPGVSMLAFGLSANGKQVVYTTPASNGNTQLWVAPLDRSAPASRVGISGAQSPQFGAHGQILFLRMEGDANYLERIDPDGSHHSKVLPYSVVEFQSVSPHRHWIIASIQGDSEKHLPELMAVPLDGGASRRICLSYCNPTWSTDGNFLFIPVQDPSQTSPGRSLAIPLGPGESLPQLPARGIPPLAEPKMVPGSVSVDRGYLVPGKDPKHYAWVNATVHRNLYRVSLY